MTKPKVIYISGLNGSLTNGLSVYLDEEYSLLDGVELNADFQSLSFYDQINTIKNLLKTYNDRRVNVIATSFGAYLSLQAIMTFEEELVFNLILLSPVLGMAMSNKGGRIPKGNSQFKKWVNNREQFVYDLPNRVSILSGDNDVICPIENVLWFSQGVEQISYEIVEKAGHQLDHDVVKAFIKSKIVS